MNKADRMRILEQLESGAISPDEAAQLLGTAQESHLPQAPANEGPQRPMDVLEDLERGDISTEEAAARLQAARAKPQGQQRPQDAEAIQKLKSRPVPEFGRFRQWWLVPFLAGLIVTAASGLWMQDILTERGIGFLFLCAWAPLGIGLALLTLGLASWSIRTFGEHIDGLDKTAIDEILMALDQTTRKGEPLYVKVHDDGDGEQVEVFIG